jgi:acetyltransferase
MMPDSVFGMVKNSTFVRFSKALAHLANGLGMPMRPDGSSATAAAPIRATPGRYPRYLEERRRLPDGTAVYLRPIRPDDAPGLRAGFRSLTRSDVRQRFFLPMKDLSPALAARLCDIDYDRHMALVALEGHPLAPGPGLGVARYVIGPEGRRAEFAIAVRSDRQLRGLGSILLDRLLAVARALGLEELFGFVLPDNQAMLSLARKRGFRIERAAEEPGALRVSKDLREAA